MIRKIQVLADDVIAKIAAGEVVERPASVVKELIENSLDAGSDSVEIDLKDAGFALIRVADNGSGMTSEEVKLAVKRHATSKLSAIHDLETLLTFGFRGEALSSISSVSRFEITTRNADGEAVYMYLENGQVKEARPAARVPGTTIEVKDLFYNVPARKKFMKKDSTELAAVIDTVGRFIVANDGVEIRLRNNGREIFHAHKNMGIKARISLVLGRDVADGMIELFSLTGKYRVTGFVSRPSSTRKDKRMQMFFVNKRYIRSTFISNLLDEANRSMLERGRFPAGVLFIEVDPSMVDVNVHPAKLLVKFEDEDELKRSVMSSVRSAFDEVKNRERGSHGQTLSEALGSAVQAPGEEKHGIFAEGIATQREFEYGAADEMISDKKPLADIPRKTSDIYQIGKCYIVRVKGDSVTVTDQHAAHERVLYEYFNNKKRETAGETQNLLFPVSLGLSPSESILMGKMKGAYKTLGFEIDEFGRNSFVIRTAPQVIKDRDIEKVVRDILSDISGNIKPGMDPVEEMVKYAACRGAIKEGDALDEHEMADLLRQLSECELPFTCPHGRPTTLEITVDELEKRFRRK
ncbi:MAG: DNA mismatch repair endonuclease MutL [Candidatus Omnitrophica bacterium]|nr:DNA mismatch repair endonuclease MutL [Candidatus Omnitrophota bacterium]